MAGHSHAANIKHRKAAVDAKRGKVFTKHARGITACVKEKGKDPSMNPNLRLLIDKARAVNMPNDNIEKAILRGAGELPGAELVEKVYEGYANDGVAIIVDVLTDNANRTGPELKHLFSKAGGSMGEPGCVSWDFKTIGLIVVPSTGVDEEELMMCALDAGADDFSQEDEVFEITTSPENYMAVETAVRDAGYEIKNSEITKIANNLISLDIEKGKKVVNLLDLFEDHDDVQNVYSNLDITADLVAALDE